MNDEINKIGMTILIPLPRLHPVKLGHTNVNAFTSIYFKAMLISILAIKSRSNAAFPRA
jgi:hypothetical protein